MPLEKERKERHVFAEERRRVRAVPAAPTLVNTTVFSGSLAFYLVLALFTFSLYTTVFLLGHSLARVAAHIAAFGIAVSGVIVLLNSTTAATARKIPLPALQLDAVAVGAFFNSLGCAAVALLETANLVLSWREPASSVRCLAYVWLLATFSSMFAPEWLVLCECALDVGVLPSRCRPCLLLSRASLSPCVPRSCRAELLSRAATFARSNLSRNSCFSLSLSPSLALPLPLSRFSRHLSLVLILPESPRFSCRRLARDGHHSRLPCQPAAP